jgi:hypothetical protein
LLEASSDYFGGGGRIPAGLPRFEPAIGPRGPGGARQSAAPSMFGLSDKWV